MSTSTRRCPRTDLRLAAILALLAIVLSACSLGVEADDSADPTPEPTTDPNAAPTPTPRPVGTAKESFDLEAGQCFNRYNIIDEVTKETERLITSVGCVSTHHGEVYGLVTHPDPGGAPFPGNIALDAFAQQECYARFAPFVGSAYELSAFEIGTFRPTADQWTTGSYRTVHCYVFIPGESVRGTAAGSAR